MDGMGVDGNGMDVGMGWDLTEWDVDVIETGMGVEIRWDGSDRAWLFAVGPSNRTGGTGKGQETDAQQVPPGQEEELPCAVTEHWDRLPREGVQSPSLDIFQKHLDTILCYVFWDDPA